ncbi:MAG: putative quinol monooxygenase [Sphingopyxis sp.]|uniref:putative quinol monooxygenase n=1 Tax=Sphingopyxis sp. TaxID=1908224 RepID=UPI003D6D590C
MPDRVRGGEGARTRTGPGCLAHNDPIDIENPGRPMFVEAWASIDAVRAHFAVPASRAFVAEMRALSPPPSAIRIYSAEDVTGTPMGALRGFRAKTQRRGRGGVRCRAARVAAGGQGLAQSHEATKMVQHRSP